MISWVTGNSRESSSYGQSPNIQRIKFSDEYDKVRKTINLKENTVQPDTAKSTINIK